MATYWVSTLGNDADGLTYATAKNAVEDGLALLTTKGDILNIVNDGTYTWPTNQASVTINTGTGTDFDTDPGYTIRGVDSNENAAKVTIASSGADGTRHFIYANRGSGYNIIENLIFDATGTPTHTQSYHIYEARDVGTGVLGPVKIRYCELLGGNTGVMSSGERAMFECPYGGPTAYAFHIHHCYFQNCQSPMGSTPGYGTTLVKFYFEDCVGIWDATGRTSAWVNEGARASGSANEIIIRRNTFYESVGNNNTAPIVSYKPVAGIDVGDIDCYSNLVWQESEASVETFMQGAGDDTTIHAGWIGNNVLIGGPSVALTDLTIDQWYEQCWDADDDDDTDPDIWPTDTQAFGVADTSLFNDPSSTYAWELPNGLTTTILKDLRPILYTDKGRFGGVPGALPSGVEEEEEEESPTDPNDEASVPFIDVLPLIGDDLQYSAVVRLGMTQNRAEHFYDRKDVEDKRWAEYAANTLELATNTTTRIRMGGVETAEALLLESTTGIQVSIGTESDTDLFYPSSKMVAVKSDFEMILVKNPSTTNAATITMVVVD